MKKAFNYILTLGLVATSFTVYAGNADRIGESGASQLLMNGWGRSTGLWDMYCARVSGLESTRLNPAGLSRIDNMQFAAAQTLWLQGSDIGITQAGVGFKLNEQDALGVSIFSLNLGDIPRTTVNNPNPQNGLGTFSPSFINIGLTYSRAFTDNIYGGVTFRLINEGIEDVRASGVSLDAGLQYVTGDKENLRFGVAIRNVGTPMKYGGDGFTYRATSPDGDNYELTQSILPTKFEQPSLLHIGASYDFWFGPEYRCNGAYNVHRVTVIGNFTSNSFGKDHFGGGVEYGFKEMFMARLGYRHEKGLWTENSSTVYYGLAGGFSVEVPFKQNGPSMGIDYSYRASDLNMYNGTHSIGLRFDLRSGSPCDLDNKDEARAL